MTAPFRIRLQLTEFSNFGVHFRLFNDNGIDWFIVLFLDLNSTGLRLSFKYEKDR